MTLADSFRPLNSAGLKGRPARAVPRLMLVTDSERLPDPSAALARLPQGAGVLVRHPDKAARAILAQRVMGVAKHRHLVVLVSEDWRLAARLGAAGVHLPERLGRSGRTAEIIGWARRRRRLLTMACHSPAALARAAQLEAQAALLSPVFPTASHPGAAALGVLRFRLWIRRARLPVLALGGVNAITVKRLRDSGAHGVVAIGALA